ncbi:hypothetical protein TSHO111613_03150 [Tsukamurella hominis]
MTPGWATIIVGTAAAVIAIVTIGQKRLADNRKEWWTRCQWALDATYSTDEPSRRDGWAIIDDLLRSSLGTRTERGISMHMATIRYREDTEDRRRSTGGRHE